MNIANALVNIIDKLVAAATLRRRYNYRIYPNADQANIMRNNIGASRYIYNHLQALGEEDLNAGRKVKHHSYTEFFAEAPWLKEVDSCALNTAKQDYYNALKRYFEDPKVGKPKRKKKSTSKASYRTSCQTNTKTIWVKKNWLKLPKMRAIKMKKHRNLPEKCRILSVTVEEKTRDEWYASICFEYEIEIPSRVVVPWDRIRGYDYSSPKLYVDDQGNSPEQMKFYRSDEDKISYLQMKKDRKEKYSINQAKAQNKVAKEYAQVVRQRKDTLDKESSRIANEVDLMLMEDLNLRSLAGSLKLGKATNDNGFGMFRAQLTYKLGERGGALVKLPKMFPSSKTCNHCGYKFADLELGMAEWDCPNCSSHNLRDKNAGMNLRECGIFSCYIPEVIDDNGEYVLVAETFKLDSGSPDFDGLFRLVRDHVLPDGVGVSALVFDPVRAFTDKDGVFVLSAVMTSMEAMDVWCRVLAGCVV